ncbi:MAG TPA: RNA polymerase sigma factor [Solirubrobacterales bacterium]|nr:RNA polymerase sigma factor [Solirubrobacterales bacterium]
MIRAGQERAFEALVDRYQVRLLAFCRGMLSSSEDAEDVLQEVFVAAHKAILADNRAINARPWLYRIARNRCLNHLRKPVPEGQDSMDIHPHENGVSVAERVQKRAEFRALIHDVQGLPETQRSALLLRELDALAYEEIAVAMDTTVPAVKSLLVRARISLADASQGRHLTCDEVHLELAEATEGLRKMSGPARSHMKDCERCREYRTQLRRNEKALAALVPIGPLAALAHALSSKLGIGGAKAGAGGSASAGAGASGAAGAGAGGSAISGAAAAGGGGLGLAGGTATIGGTALGAKAAAGMASVALFTAGAVEVKKFAFTDAPVPTPQIEQEIAAVGPAKHAMHGTAMPAQADEPAEEVPAEEPPADPPPEVPPAEPEVPADPEPPLPPEEPVPPTTDETTTEEPLEDVPTNPGDSGGVINLPPDEPPIVEPPPIEPPDEEPPPEEPPPSDPAPRG